VSFAQMNLASPVYLGRMDAIFCMNVLIYFSEQRRRALVQSFYETLEPGGYLFLGHSESISKMPVKFQAIVLNDCILYRKPAADALLKSELVTEVRACAPGTTKPSRSSFNNTPNTCHLCASTTACSSTPNRTATTSSGPALPRADQ